MTSKNTDAAAAVATATAGRTETVEASKPIRFREETGGVADSATGVLLILVLLLGGCLVFALIAKKKGWLDRWVAQGGPAAGDTKAMRIEQTLRLSPRTVMYRVSDDRGRYVVIESTVNARMTVLPVDADIVPSEADNSQAGVANDV